MGRKDSLKGRRLSVDKEKEEILQEIVNKAIERKDINGILRVIKNPELSVSTKSLIAKIYLNTVKSITTRIFFKTTLKKIAKSIRRIELCLQENGLNNTAQEIRKSWDTWLQKELWQKIRNKTQQPQKEKPRELEEKDILKRYLE